MRRALEPKTLRESRVQTCDSDIVALEYIPMGGLASVNNSNKSHMLAVAMSPSLARQQGVKPGSALRGRAAADLDQATRPGPRVHLGQ